MGVPQILRYYPTWILGGRVVDLELREFMTEKQFRVLFEQATGRPWSLESIRGLDERAWRELRERGVLSIKLL